MTTIELYVQAEVLPIRLRLGPAGGIGHLETLVLRAIAVGVDDIDDLADVFGIPPRLVLDMVGDLWRVGRVALDIGAEREAITLSSAAREELSHLDEHGSLPSGYRATDSQQVLLEKLTGRILPLRGSTVFPRDRSLVVPTSSDDPSRADIDPNAVVTAVMAGMEDRRTSRSANEVNGMRVVSAMLSPDANVTAGVHRYVRVTVEASLDARDELVVAVEDENLSLAAREIATRRLDTLLSSDPQPPLTRRMRSLVSKTPFKPRDVARLVAEFGRAVDALSECAPANRQRRHDSLSNAARGVYEHVDTLARQEMDVTVVRSDGEHKEAILRLLSTAHHQVVIAVPWVREKGLRPYVRPLTEAVERGVSVILLWGIRRVGDELEDSVRSLLLTIQRAAIAAGRGGRLAFPPLPSHLHAKVVVADDRRALVTSRNFFSGSNLKELGVILEAMPGQPAPVLEDVLQWAHRVIPSAAIANLLARRRTAFGTGEYESQLPPLVLPDVTAALFTAAPDAPNAQIWCEGWQAVVGELSRLLHRDRPVVSLVTDGYHRTLAYRALDEATQRVVIASDGFSANAVTTGMVEAARAAAARGVDVTFVFGRGRDQDASARVEDLKRPESGSCVPVVREVTDHHAKVLVRDDRVVVGSYNYLSLDASRARGRTTGELSVLVESATVSEAVARTLQRAPRAGDASQAAQLDVDPPGVPVAVAVAAQRVLEVFSGSDGIVDPDEVARLLLGSGAPDEVVGLLGARATSFDQERALAALVYSRAQPDEVWHRWARDLVSLAWGRGAWWVAHQLRMLVLPGPDVPSEWLTSAAAADVTELVGVLSSLAVDDTVPPDERDALCLLGVVQLLRTGDLALQDPIRVWAATSSSAVRAPAGAVLDGVALYGALPSAARADAVRNQAASARADSCWHALDHAVSELRRYKPKTPPGVRLLSALFGAGEEMTELEGTLALRDVERLHRWCVQHPEHEDARWVDRASASAGLPRPIDGSQRGSFIHKHAAIRRAVNAVREAARDVHAIAEIDPGQLRVIEQIETLLIYACDETADTPANTLARRQVDQLLGEIRSDATLQAAGATWESWRFPRGLLTQSDTDAPLGVGTVRLVAADVCSAWSPAGAVRWLASCGEYAVADRLLADLPADLPLTEAELETLSGEIDAQRASCASAVDDGWSLLRARTDCTGVAMPPGWEAWRALRRVERREQAQNELERAVVEVGVAVDAARAGIVAALSARRHELDPARALRIENLIDVNELVAARHVLLQDDSEAFVPVGGRPRSWPLRHSSLRQILHQFDSEEHRYPSVSDFVPPEEDEDGLRLLAALRTLDTQHDESSVSGYIEAVQRLVADPGVPRRIRQVRGGYDHEGSQTAEVSSATSPACVVTLVLPHHPTLPMLHWTGKDVLAAVGDQKVDGALFRISLRVLATSPAEAVLDISSVLSLLPLEAGRVASRQVRVIRLLRTICPNLPLSAVVDVNSFDCLDSADVRVRLWTLLHILGFDVDEVGRSSLYAVGGDHPHLLWRLIDTALRELKEPDADSVQVQAQWNTTRLMGRDDFDDIVRAAVEADLTDPGARAVLAAVAIEGGMVGVTPSAATELVAGGSGNPEEQDAIAAMLDGETVGRHLAYLREKRYVVDGPNGLVCVKDSVVGRSIIRNDPGPWLEQSASEMLERLGGPEAALVRALSHSLVQSYRVDSDDPQSLGPDDLRNPDVPCWADRWAAIVLSRSGIQGLYASRGISVTQELGEDLWVAGPPVAFALLLDNLVHNAAAALGQRPKDDPGRILVTVEDDPQHGAVRVEVADNGPGLTAQVLADLVAGTLLPRGKRGHGLAEAAQYAREYGWQMTANRHENLGGASMVVLIPRRSPPVTR
jgi:phosphatidylserine/phosphatidylglycerophosphate/cardiolipin synthase-like enzyme